MASLINPGQRVFLGPDMLLFDFGISEITGDYTSPVSWVNPANHAQVVPSALAGRSGRAAGINTAFDLAGQGSGGGGSVHVFLRLVQVDQAGTDIALGILGEMVFGSLFGPRQITLGGAGPGIGGAGILENCAGFYLKNTVEPATGISLSFKIILPRPLRFVLLN